MEVIKNKRILALVGIAGLILGCFLPYYTFSLFGYTQSISLWGYWEGKIILVLTLANALFIFQDYIEKYIPQLFNNWIGNIVQTAKNPKLALVPTILVAVFAISLIIRLDVDSKYIKYGLGFWVLWIGIIALIGHAIFYKKQNVKSAQQVANYQPMQQSMQQPVQQPTQQSQIDPTKKFCPHCRNQVDVNAETCFMCGNKF